MIRPSNHFLAFIEVFNHSIHVEWYKRLKRGYLHTPFISSTGVFLIKTTIFITIFHLGEFSIVYHKQKSFLEGIRRSIQYILGIIFHSSKEP